MLTPDYLDTLPDALVKLWQTVEDDILRDVARRIAKMQKITEAADWQLYRFEQVQALHQDVVAILAKYSGKTRAQIRKLLQEAGRETLASDDEVYRAMGFMPGDINKNPALVNLLQAGYHQTWGTWRNLTATTANTVTKQFEDAMDRAWLQVSSGAFDYQTAIRHAVDDLAAGGIKAVTYPTRHTDTLEVAARRCVLTGVNQTAAKLQMERANEMGCEFVEVTAHAGARPEHAVWQGKVYHVGGETWYEGKYYEGFEAATGYGTGPGLCGWNCRHGFYPFFPGVSAPLYSEEDLKKLSDPALYERIQRKNALERRVRDAKRRYLAAQAAGLDTTKEAVRLKKARQTLAQYTDETGLRTDSSRTMVHGFGRSAASKATWDVLSDEKKRARIKAIIRADIQSGKIISKINKGHQNKHILYSKGYIPGKSYIYGGLETAQALVDQYHGTGEIRLDRAGKWIHKEFILADGIIGVAIDPELEEQIETRRFAIHYGKKGVHIVPMKEVDTP